MKRSLQLKHTIKYVLAFHYEVYVFLLNLIGQISIKSLSFTQNVLNDGLLWNDLSDSKPHFPTKKLILGKYDRLYNYSMYYISESISLTYLNYNFNAMLPPVRLLCCMSYVFLRFHDT